jgi:flagellar biosynthesis/type III secretory pathway M-ring protein FliF/YscJ
MAVAVSVALAALMVRGYVATPAVPAVDYLYAGQRFSTDEIDAITRALAVKHIKAQGDGTGRIGVASDQLDAATDVLAKLVVGPRSIPEILEWANQSSLLASPAETERRQIRAREMILENMIGNLDGIVRAYVTINRTRPAGGFRPTPASASTAFVWLQTERNREIGSKTVQSIQTILKGYEPDLKHDAVTVVDQKGHHYLDAGNPALGVISLTRAREEELSQEILDELDWIKGVSVTVQLPLASARVEPPAPPPAPVPTPPASGDELAPSHLSMSLNRPLEIGPEPGADSTPAPVPAATAGEPKPAGGEGQGTVWVKVPRSFYRRMIEKEPSLELAAVKSHIEKDIRTAVEMKVPRGEPWTVKIGSILDDSTSAGMLPSRTVSPSRRPIPWWSLAVTATAVAITVMAAAYRTVVSRRPVPRQARGVRRGRYPIDTAPEPGHAPSERVRELVRFNPEAAAGVLQRWIGQGGHVG